MEKLLSSKGIQTVDISDENGNYTAYAFTDHLLEKKTVIKYYNTLQEDDQTETIIHVLMNVEPFYYYIYIYHQLGMVPASPLFLTRMIIDLVEFITYCDKSMLHDEIITLSTGFDNISPSSWSEDDPKQYLRCDEEFKRIEQLIAHKRMKPVKLQS